MISDQIISKKRKCVSDAILHVVVLTFKEQFVNNHHDMGYRGSKHFKDKTLRGIIKVVYITIVKGFMSYFLTFLCVP